MALSKNKSSAARDVIESVTGRSLSPRTVLNQSRNHFDSWLDVLRQSGLPAHEIQKKAKRIAWTPEKVIEIIQFLAPHFDRLSTKQLKAETPKLKQLTFEKFGEVIRPFTLWQLSSQFFGSWKNALARAGFSETELQRAQVEHQKRQHRKVQKERGLDPEGRKQRIRKTLVELHKRGYLKGTVSFMNHPSADLRRLIRELMGYKITAPESLYRLAILHFGSWPHALHAAGLPVFEIVLPVPRVPLSKEFVSEALWLLYRRHALTAHQERFIASRKISQILFEEYQVPVSGYRLWRATLEHYGGWRQALREIDLYERLTEREPVHHGNIALLPYVVEFEEQADGTSRAIRQFGEQIPNPEEALATQEQNEHVHSGIAGLGPRQQAIGFALLEYLDENDDLSQRESVIEFVARKIKEPVHWPDIASALTTLSETLSRDDRPQ